MNKKITVRRSDGKVRFCVLSGERNLQEQFNEWYYGAPQPDGGYSVILQTDKIKIIDYIAYDTVADFNILSIEDTEAEVSLVWTDPETMETGWN